MNCLLCDSNLTELIHEKIDLTYGRKVYHKCSVCDLIFMEPEYRLSPEDEKARYDTHNNDPSDSNYIYHLEKLTKPLSEKLKPGNIGLDYGCGPGPAIQQILMDQGFYVFNYDPFFFPDESLLQRQYDFIACTETFEHFFDPCKEIERLDTLLKPEGSYLGVMTELFDPEIDFKDWWYQRDPTHVVFYQIKTLNWIAQWKNWSLEMAAQNIAIFHKQPQTNT